MCIRFSNTLNNYFINLKCKNQRFSLSPSKMPFESEHYHFSIQRRWYRFDFFSLHFIECKSMPYHWNDVCDAYYAQIKNCVQFFCPFHCTITIFLRKNRSSEIQSTCICGINNGNGATKGALFVKCRASKRKISDFIIITLRVTNYLDVCYLERLLLWLLLLRESILTIIMMTLFFSIHSSLTSLYVLFFSIEWRHSHGARYMHFTIGRLEIHINMFVTTSIETI